MAPGNKNIELPEEAKLLARRFADAGGNLFIVGGWLRDLLLGSACQDIDFATDMAPSETKEIVNSLGPVYAVGEKYGTIGLIMGGYTIEITTFRSDFYTPGSRHPEVEVVHDIAEDLSRRDFTINAMALEVAPRTGQIIDPLNGMEDLEHRLIRTPGPPGRGMAEDPLRMMRAVRFAAQLGFDMDAELLEVLENDSARLESISGERRRDELEKILVTPHPDAGIRILVDTGLMEHVCPEISEMDGVGQPPAYHRADVLGHTLLTMTHVRRSALLRRAALFHDVGKPRARTTVPKVSFPDHDKIGEELTREAMKRLKYGNEEVQKTVFLVRRHMRPIHYEPGWSDSAVRRLIKDCTLIKQGEVVVPLSDVMELARADVRAGAEAKVPVFLQVIDDLEKRIDDLGAHHEIHRATSPLDGDELIELFGRGPGPWLRPLKRFLMQEVIDGHLGQDDKAAARRMAIEFEASRPNGSGSAT